MRPMEPCPKHIYALIFISRFFSLARERDGGTRVARHAVIGRRASETGISGKFSSDKESPGTDKGVVGRKKGYIAGWPPSTLGVGSRRGSRRLR
ncbi:unnamed protein product, partial [Iphiclides podalirius]